MVRLDGPTLFILRTEVTEDVFMTCRAISRMALKGTQSEDLSWPESIENVLVFLMCRLRSFMLRFYCPVRGTSGWLWWCCQCICNQNAFLLWVWAPPGAAMLVHSLPIKSRKRWVHDVINTCATYPGLARLPDTKRQCSQPCFCDFQTLNFNTPDHKLTETLLWEYVLLHSYW